MSKQDEIKKFLSNTNVIPKESLFEYDFKLEDINQFCDNNGLVFEVSGHGDWVWIQFKKDGELVENFDGLLGVK